MFLVYESARVESRRTDEINHKFEASMGLTGPQTGMIMHLGFNYFYVHVGALGACRLPHESWFRTPVLI